MAARYLLDTNIISHLYRHPQGAVFERIQSVGEDSVCTSIVVAAELRFGAAKRGSSTLTDWVETVLSMLTVHPWDTPVDRVYADVRADLEKRGQLIGANDMLIAAHALHLNATLVTHNTSEFSRISTLDLVDWLE